jgi:choice-of-anchor B domain-containing protein
MNKILILILVVPLFSIAQSSYNMTLLGSYEWPTTEGSDIWGWVDPVTEDEYALVGLNDGFSCVNVTDPSNPIEEFYISDLNSTWRDIKTWGNYAYVTTEADAGLLIVDLTDMTGNTYWHVSQFTNPTTSATVSFTAAHNLYIDENGICYIFGASSNSGGNPSDGAVFLDVASNATSPVYLGEWNDEYIHDGMVRGDTMYAGCIYTGGLYIVDVSDKGNPFVLGTHQTPNSFTHNAWVSDDGNYVFTTDEKPDAYIGSYDISDMSNIQEVDRIQSNPESNSIPHNTHVDGDFLVTSWYRDGTIVHDISNPNNLVQVAYYDSYVGSGDGFDGCWGTYPFLPSGNIISSEINSSNNQTGQLMIYERGFSSACYLEGNVTDGNTGNSISGATVVILNTVIPNSSSSTLSGSYSSGNADSGTFDVVFSITGYISDTLQVALINGQIVVLNAVLYIDPSMPILGCMDPLATNFNPNANTSLEYGGEVDNTFSSGGYSNGNKHLIFDASAELLIKSAVFYADNPNVVTFELRNSSGIVIDDTTHYLIQGQQQLVLNFEVPIGTDMELGIANGNSGLYRNDSGAIYPYLIGSIMNITGASNQSSQDNWYYFYNMEIEVPCENISTTISNIVKSDRKLLKITDVLGREVQGNSNQTLFYLFDDGTVERRVTVGI